MTSGSAPQLGSVDLNLETRRVLDALPDAIILMDVGGSLTFANRAAAELLATPPDTVVGRSLFTILPYLRHHEVVALPRPSDGGPLRVVVRRGDDSCDEVELAFTACEFGPSKLLMARLRPVLDQDRREHESRLPAALLSVVTESDTLATAAPRVLESVATSLRWDSGTLWLVDGDEITLTVAADWHAWSSPNDRERQARDRAVGTGELARTAMAERRPVVMPGTDASDATRGEVVGIGGRAQRLAFPLTAHGRVIGAIELGRDSSEPTDGTLADELPRLGQELGEFIERRRVEEERVELLAREHEARDAAEAAQQRSQTLARTLQQSLLPPNLPTVPGVELAARYHPGGDGAEVGGDFYDVFRTGRGTWGIVLGDVCGKDAPAAAVTALARHTVRAAAMQTRSPAKALRMLNAAMLRHPAAGDEPNVRFATVVFCTLRRQRGQLSLQAASGGHPLPVILRRDGRTASIGTPGTLLGVVRDVELADTAVELAPGDAVVLYTDGVTEARRGTEQFGDERLDALLRTRAGDDAHGIATAVDEAVATFRGDEARDDVAILVARAAPNPHGDARNVP